MGSRVLAAGEALIWSLSEPLLSHFPVSKNLSGLGGIQVATNCMNPRSRYARGLHVRPCRGTLSCSALPPSNRVNLA